MDEKGLQDPNKTDLRQNVIYLSNERIEQRPQKTLCSFPIGEQTWAFSLPKYFNFLNRKFSAW